MYICISIRDVGCSKQTKNERQRREVGEFCLSCRTFRSTICYGGIVFLRHSAPGALVAAALLYEMVLSWRQTKMRRNKNTDGHVCMSLFLSVQMESCFCLPFHHHQKKKKERTPTVLALYLFFFFLRGKNESYKNAPKQRLFFFVVSLQGLFFCFLIQKVKQNLRRCLSAPVLFPETTGWKN